MQARLAVHMRLAYSVAMTVVNLFLPVSEADEREGATFDVAEEGGRAVQVVLDQFGI